MMDWSNERFIKVYTRDTADWMTLSFEAQALFMLILRKLDRSGRLELGRQGMKSIAVAIGHGSLWSKLEPAMNELLADGCVQITTDGKTLLVRNFVDAQEARKSNAQRQRDFKEDKRTKSAPPPDDGKGNNALPNANETLVLGNETSPKGNEEKHSVTPGNPSEQNRLEQNRTEEIPQTPLPQPSAGAPPASPAESAPKRKSPKPKGQRLTPTAEEQSVFDHWVLAMGKTGRTIFDDRRIAPVRASLAAGFTVDDLKRAIDGCAKDPFSMGTNDRNTPWNDLTLICRDAPHVEKFMTIEDRSQARPMRIVQRKDWQLEPSPLTPEQLKTLQAHVRALKAGHVG